MDTLTIRRSTAADLTEVDLLFASSYPRLLAADYPPSAIVTAIPLLARAQPHLLKSGRYFVAETSEGRIVGAGGWSRSGAVQSRGEVRHLVTDWRMTRRGIATAIVRQVIGDAAAAGVSALDCLATRTAVPFYSALGFRALGPVTMALRPGIEFTAVRMIRDI
jgi:GNAT superfamily N-acetyltransferase